MKEDHLIFRAAILATLSIIGLPFAVSAQEPGPALGRIYDALEVTRGPQVVQAPRLSVPDGFDLATVRDTTIITFVVDTTGRVDANSIVIVRAGDPVVRAALNDQVRQSVYTPGWLGQKPVQVRLRRQFPLPAPMTVVRVPITKIRERVRALTGSGPFAAPTLDHRYQRRESCEGYPCGCGYGTWQANDTLRVYSAELDTSHVAFHLKPGERLDAQRGYHHVLRPAVVIVFDTLKEYQHRFLPGDTLYVLQYVGELSYRVQHKDSVTEIHRFWAPQRLNGPKGALVQAGVEEWWVPIRTASGRSGWIRPHDRALLRGPNQFCIPAADSTIW